MQGNNAVAQTCDLEDQIVELNQSTLQKSAQDHQEAMAVSSDVKRDAALATQGATVADLNHCDDASLTSAQQSVKECAQQSAQKEAHKVVSQATKKAAPSSEDNVATEEFSTVEKVAWSTTIILSMLAAFGPVCTDIYLPAVPTITRDLMTNASAMQLTLTASFIGLALGQLFIGPVSDAYGRKKPLYVSLVVFIISSIGCALATNITQLIIARLFQGLSGAGGVVLSRSIACDFYSGSKLTKFMSLLMTINGLAPIFGPIVGSSIVSVMPWHALFYFLAAWGVLLLLFSLTKLPESLPEHKRMPKIMATVKDMLSQLTNMRFMAYALSMSFIMGAFFGYLSASPFIFQSIFGMSPLGYSIVFGIIAICIAISANVAGVLSRRVSDNAIVRGSLAIQMTATICLTALLITGLANMYLVAICFCFFVSMIGSSQSSGFGIVMGARSGGAGSASGIFGVMTFMFGAITSPLVGLMGEDSMIPMIIVMYVCTIMSFICFAIGVRLSKKVNDLHEVDLSDVKVD